MDICGCGYGEHAKVTSGDGLYLYKFYDPANDADDGGEDQEAVSVAYSAGKIGAD